jgi:hypothetical protein
MIFLAINYSIGYLNTCIPFLDSMKTKIDVVASTVAAFSFTLLGFQSGIITIILAGKNNSFLDFYKSNGGLSYFIQIYFLSLFCLVITFILSVISYAFPSCIQLAFSMAILNLLHIIFIFCIVLRINSKSM